MEKVLRVFISATSSDLGSARRVVRDALLTNGIFPDEQSDFAPDYRTIADLLARKISACDAVVCLVGCAFGAEPFDRAPDQLRRSYTQIEYDTARRLRKPIYLFLAGDTFPFDSIPDEDTEKRQLQLAHRESIRNGNARWEEFASLEQLRQRVAHIRFPTRTTDERCPQNLPYISLGSLFKGRASLMDDLQRRLLEELPPVDESSGADVQHKVLCGLGGVGKTRLAVEYASRFKDNYTALLFVVADSAANLGRNLAALTGPMVLNLADVRQSPEEDRIAAALSWLADHPRWCLILDNVDTYEAQQAVTELLVRLSGGHVLITSRLSESEWSHDVEPLHLDVLAPADARDFLLERTARLRRRTPTDEADAAQLLHELDGLALALEQAGAFIERQRCSIGDYLKRWKAGESRVREWSNATLTHYPTSLAVTWDTTMRAISPEAAALLRVLSFMAPGPVPDAVLATDGAAAILAETIAPGASQAMPYPDEALVELTAFSMVRRSEDQGVPCFSLHCVVQEITRKRIPPDAYGTSLQQAVRLLLAHAPQDSYRFEAWTDWRLLIGHAEMLWSYHQPAAGQDQPTLPESAWSTELIGALALFYLGQSRETDAVPLQRIALRLLSERLPADHPTVLLAKNDLALMLDSQSNGAEKESLYKEALEGRRRVCGELSVDTAETLHNYGDFLRNTGRLDEAETLLGASMATFAKVCGPNHWRTLMAEIGLARIRWKRGDRGTAIAMVRDNLAKKRQHLLPNHADTLESIDCLADYLEISRELTESESLRREYVTGCRAAWGPGHPRTFRAINILADFLLRRGRSDEAVALCRDVLATRASLLGSDHPETWATMQGLARLLQQLGHLGEAIDLHRQAVAARERTLGPRNPSTLDSKAQFAQFLAGTGHTTEAVEIFKQVVAVYESFAGPPPPEYIRSLNNLAYALRKSGDPVHAETLDRRAVAASETVLGPTHILVAHRRNNLVLSLILLGRLEEAATELSTNESRETTPHENLTPRIAFLRFVVCVLAEAKNGPADSSQYANSGNGSKPPPGSNVASELGKLKRVLQAPLLPVTEGIQVPWDLDYFITGLGSRISTDQAILFRAVVAVLNERCFGRDGPGAPARAALEQLPAWRDASTATGL